MTPLCICRSKPFLLPSSFSRRRLFPGHDFKQCFILLMCHLLQPIFYDVVSSLMCHLFLYPLWLDSTGCEVSPCYEDMLKTGFGLSVFYLLVLHFFKCNAIAYALHLRGVLRSISIGLGVLIGLGLSPLSPKSCVLYICPMGSSI